MYKCKAKFKFQNKQSKIRIFMKQKKDKTNIWINIQEASRALGLSEQTLKRQCRRGEFVFKIVKKGKHANYFIMLKSMPDFAQDKYLGETEFEAKYSEAPNWAKQQAEKYLQILENSKGLKGNDLKEFIEEWNKVNEPTSYSSIIKMRRRY